MEYEAASLMKGKKKKDKLKRNRDASILGPQVENCIQKDLETAENNPALSTKQKKKRKNQQEKLNASEKCIVHNDLEEGLVLVENPPLKSDVDNCLQKDLDTAQNNPALGRKQKKKKNNQQEELNASENCNIHNDREEGSVLVEIPPLKSDVDNCLQKDLEIPLNNPALGKKHKKKKKYQQEKLNASENCNLHNDRGEGSVLVENFPLKSDVDNCLQKDLENPLSNPTLGRKHKKKRKYQLEKLNASENCNIHNDRGEGSVLMENPPLKSDVDNCLQKDLENPLNNPALGGKHKKKRKYQQEKLNASENCNIQNDRGEGSVLVENPPLESDVHNCLQKDLETAQNNPALRRKQKKKKKNQQEELNASENCSIHNDREEGSVLVENPPLESDVDNCLQKDLETELNNPALGGKQKKKKKKRNQQEELNASENCNIHNDREEGSVLVKNPPLESDVDNCLQKDLETALNNPAPGRKQKKKRKYQQDKLNASENCNIHNDCGEGSVLVENPPLESDVETLQNNATLGVKEKKMRKRKKKEHHSLEDSSIHNGFVEGSLLVENLSPLKRDVNVETAQNNEALVCNTKKKIKNKWKKITKSCDARSIAGMTLENEKNKDKKHSKRCTALDNNNIDHDFQEGGCVSSLNLVNSKHMDKEVLSSVSNHVELDSRSIKENSEPPIVGSSEFSVIPPENIKTYKRRKQEQSKTHRKTRKVSYPVGLILEPIKEDETTQVPESSSTRESLINCSGERSMVQVVEDISVEEASATFADGELASGKSNSRTKAENLEETGNIDSFGEDLSVLSIPMGRLEHNMGRQEKIQIAVQEAVHVEKVLNESTTCDKNFFFNDPSERVPSCKLLEQKNVLMVNIEEKKLTLSNLDSIEDDADLLINNRGKPPQVVLSSPERAISGHSRKKLLILDVNGLLADIVSDASHGYTPDTTISGKKVFKRPFCKDFLQFCLERFDVGVWSSRTKRNVDMAINFLMGNMRSRLLFCWDQTHCTQTGLKTLENREKPLVLKELRKFWEKDERYNESNTLLLDDSPYKALRNPAHTAIFPHTYQYIDIKDCSLGPGGDLRVYLEGLATSENVQDYVKQNPFGQGPITESNLSWDFYRKIVSYDSYQHNVTKAQSH